MSNPAMIQTRNRKLEVFYHMHGVVFVRQFKDCDGMTIWEYEPTAENYHIRQEFIEGQRRLSARKGA